MTTTTFANGVGGLLDIDDDSTAGVLNSDALVRNVVEAIPASVPQQQQQQQYQPAPNRLTDAQIAAINQQLASAAQAASANYPQAAPAAYPQAIPAAYPQAIPAAYPQALPADYPQTIPASYRPVAPQNVQYIPYPVASKHDDEEEEDEDEEEEDEDEEDEEEFDADDLVTRRRR
ncbi:hypothetical protein HMPREF1544_00817 [Mucor circinelloides 1006PhL]|uniref:Uncharacterized protein n=1 Tax=Mucor circinelloides f. circinelloides (strain 1006PhL) TaxID=1220926 RepID=S2K9Z7_MUCC1|nr:hypothetical protein HMPREF1544_00817 [Mucor circinelloides 1006PhL]KAG1103704.1 hypothetical protein G6F42_017187 [Rhizopus arrhizus]